MSLFVTLGGDRLGSGNQQKQELHNYMMNSFNLEQDFKSSMAPGVLYPFIKMVGTNHGTFDIDLDTFVRTIPTRGPLFGSFKLQLDLFSVPFRLYQGVLHNNPVDIGLKMSQVYLPKIMLGYKDGKGAPRIKGSNEYNWQINESSLMKYLGLSGIGRSGSQQSVNSISRKLQCVPLLAYYDIFKCYYSNKQEENAYVITPGEIRQTSTAEINRIYYNSIMQEEVVGEDFQLTFNVFTFFNIYGNNMNGDTVSLIIKGTDLNEETVNETKSLNDWRDEAILEYEERTNGQIEIKIYENALTDYNIDVEKPVYVQVISTPTETVYTANIALTPFKLKNIDDMRNFLLSNCTLGTEVILRKGGEGSNIWNEESGSDSTGLPYSACFNYDGNGIHNNSFEMNGLMIKTYQSDLFNNWLDTEFIDGEQGISAITAVSTTGGSFTMDSLNLAEKFYELLNRILVSGGTYQDWQEAVYGEGAVRVCETPMYIGGMAAEIMFEEVISSAETNVAGDRQALGSLAGKGQQVGKKGGNNIHVKMDEPGYIMGIVSITPRICYSQGNDWDLTELDSLDDLHKPALDGIGFQPLMVEQFAWWDTVINPSGSTILHRNSAGKQTAWINYQTAVDKCYGDFAKQDGYSFMVLNRNYEMGEYIGQVKDITTYIDPAKYNYAFAYSDLAAQNFWVQIHSRVIARRKMGAQQIPNL